ncbi:hypothetical protein B0O99DRAFT_236947 [Bisporella sp. PMI_857]|nr:hypothetical protein B0O99DRAFT_236947 [Bisporella sp. PMI_857]
MLNQLRAWNVPIIGRGGGPSVAKSSRPLNNGRASQIPKRTKPNANTNTNNTTNANPNPNPLVRPQHPSPAAETSSSPLDRSPQAISVYDPPQDASPHSSSDGNDTMSQLERVIQRVNILDAEAKAYKQQLEMQNQGMQTQQQEYALVHAMAEQNARATEETKTKMLILQNCMNQMQEDNSALRVEITELRNENQALRFEINQYKLQIFQQEKEMADLRDQSHVMRNNYHSLLHTLGDLKREKEALLQQKEAEANLNMQLKQHIREFLKIFSAPYTRCLKYDVERLATSLTKLNLEDDRRRSRDSGFFSGSQSNDSNRLLSVNDHTSRGTNPKRPRHETGPPQMERSVSDGQYGNSPATHASRNRWPLTEPQSLDTRSIISRHEALQDEEIRSVAPQSEFQIYQFFVQRYSELPKLLLA